MLITRRSAAAALLGLSAVGAALAASKLPDWMASPPADDAQFWYGTGEGPDLESARRTALRNVAAKLRSTIEGKVSNTTSVQSSGGKERVNVQAQTTVMEEVAKTEFTRFDVVQSAKGGQGVYALVKVDRAAFVADTRNQLQVIDKPVQAAVAAQGGQTSLDRFLSLRRLKPQLADGLRLSMLLQGAGADDEGRAGVRRYGELLQSSADLGTQLSFELRAPPADADVATAVAALLSEQGMRSATTRTAGSNPVTLQTEGRQDELFGSKMLKLKLRLALMDPQGRAVATQEFEASGSSRYDFKGAREDAVKKLVEQMRKAGPLGALGIKE